MNDRLVWFHAPSLMGGDGKQGVQAYGVEKLADMHRYKRSEVRQVGDDLVEYYARAH